MTDSERQTTRKRVTEDTALWRAEAWDAFAQIEDELHRATAQSRRSASKAFQTTASVVRGDLDEALAAMVPSESNAATDEGARKWIVRQVLHCGKALNRYYAGSAISKAWAAIYRAGGSLFTVYDRAELYAQATRLEGLVADLPDSKPQGKILSDAREKLKDSAQRDEARALLRQVYRGAIAVTESLQIEARVLRNTLLISSAALSVIVLAVGVVNLLDANVFSLCSPIANSKQACPIGGEPHRFDVFIVELAGMLGGILSVVIPLSTGERIKTPYRVFNHQLLLKVVAGAGTALVGIILVQSAFTSTISVDSGAMIIGYAVFFGFSQQAVTGILDRKASKLGEETPTAKSV